MAHGSRKAVVYAIAGNGFLTVLKFGAAFATHSAAMMNEAVHSLMDTVNQVFLLVGLIRGGRPADRQYAFGHGQKRYLWNLWSAIGLFSIGCGLGLAHAWHAYHQLGIVERPTSVSIAGIAVDPIWVSVVVLTIAFVIEGYVLYVAGREFLSRMRTEGRTDFFHYLYSAEDPTLVAVVLEDAIALTGVVLAAAGIGLSQVTGNYMWDILFSVLIALMLGVTAVFLGKVNMHYLSSIRDQEAEQAFREVVKAHPEVDRYHDLRSVVVDENHTVVVAEVELREEALTSGLRERIEMLEQETLELLPEKRRRDESVQEYVETRSVIQATLERTERIVDELEVELKQKCPQVFHLTVEVEGIAPTRDLGQSGEGTDD